uniref:Uncharacterized protein n=1 Tax=Compsopogon caeruleus TaxID=31354 RepID=A0A7S1THX9_9RHOD
MISLTRPFARSTAPCWWCSSGAKRGELCSISSMVLPTQYSRILRRQRPLREAHTRTATVSGRRKGLPRKKATSTATLLFRSGRKLLMLTEFAGASHLCVVQTLHSRTISSTRVFVFLSSICAW